MVKVRAVLIQSNAPKYLWGEALQAIVYIYNRTPYSALGFKTPYEVANNIKLSIDNIKIWGSITYYKIKGPKRLKLEPQAEKGILVGYGENNNNYKVFDLKLRKIIWLRDVKVLEGQFLKEK